MAQTFAASLDLLRTALEKDKNELATFEQRRADAAAEADRYSRAAEMQRQIVSEREAAIRLLEGAFE